MCEQFVRASSKEMTAAQAKLKQRAPLGSTDMMTGCTPRWRAFRGPSENSRSVVYIGDGMSRANLFGDPEVKELVQQLVGGRTAVSCFAIGPERNVAFLAVLANQTGGVLFVDSNDESAAAEGRIRVGTGGPADSPVAAGCSLAGGDCRALSLGRAAAADRPRHDSDRQTGVACPATADDDGGGQGKTMELSWELVAERSSEDFAFLADPGGSGSRQWRLDIAHRRLRRLAGGSARDFRRLARSVDGRSAPRRKQTNWTRHFILSVTRRNRRASPLQERSPQNRSRAAAAGGQSDLLSEFDPTSKLLDAGGSGSRCA